MVFTSGLPAPLDPNAFTTRSTCSSESIDRGSVLPEEDIVEDDVRTEIRAWKRAEGWGDIHNGLAPWGDGEPAASCLRDDSVSDSNSSAARNKCLLQNSVSSSTFTLCRPQRREHGRRDDSDGPFQLA